MVSFTSFPVGVIEARDAHIADAGRSRNARSTLGESTSSGVKVIWKTRGARAEHVELGFLLPRHGQQLDQLFEFQSRQQYSR